MPLYIDNAVSTEQRIWIETHLINCSKCNNEKELLSKTVTLIKETRERNACFDITWKVAESERSAIKRPYEYIAVPVVLLLIILVITGYLIG
ncbi:MAG: zf-HC2 domain-containing protein, partial [Bacteroidales bacterium]|nr:zf-HC2 domain-containing protein [Bacteroidales bacterium]